MPAYKVRRRLISVGRDYDIEDESGKAVFRLDGKVGFARRFVIKDSAGNSLLAVREKLLSIDPLFVIKKGVGTVATVRRRSHSDARIAKFEIEINGRTAMGASGSFLRDGIQIVREGAQIGNVSRVPLTVIEEIFHVEAAATEDQSLILSIAMSIVEMSTFRGEDRS